MSDHGPGVVNVVWARALLDELARAGLREVCLAPGSRSTPLVLAAAASGGIRLRVLLDERSAAFFALGVARGSGRPAAVVTTSGTAVANLLPAVVEAGLSDVPLLLLTADRPRRLRGADANQTIDQAGLLASHARASLDLPPASLDARALRHLRAVAARAWADAVGAPAGPVHLNVPFDEPLHPGPGASVPTPEEAVPEAFAGRPAGEPAVRIPRRRPAAGEDELDALAELLAGATRGVVVAGPAADPEAAGPAALRLAAATGFPLLADPLSGARWSPPGEALVLGAYDLFLAVADARTALRPDLVVRVGRAPTSKHLAAWLGEHRDASQVVVDDGGRWKDHGATAALYLRAGAADTLTRLASRVPRSGSEAWRTRWSGVEAATHGAVRGSDAFGPGHEGAVLRSVVEAAGPDVELFVGNSMPVRDLDAYCGPAHAPHPLTARGNRGASGIDGTVSTALGVAAGAGRRVVAVLGDLAFHHDGNGLLATREADLDVVFVVIHNDGGGIFHMLPVRAWEPSFTRYFATPHGLDFRHVAELYGLPYTRVDDPADLPGALAAALGEPGSRVVEVRTDRDENEALHRAVREAVRDAVLAALEGDT